MDEPLYSDESPEDRALDELIVWAMQTPTDLKDLPPLTAEERAAMDALPPLEEILRRADLRENSNAAE